MAYGYQEGRLCGGFLKMLDSLLILFQFHWKLDKKTNKLWLQIMFSDYFDEWHTLGNWIESMQKALQDSLTLLPTSNDEQQEKYVKHEVKTQIPPSTEWGNL